MYISIYPPYGEMARVHFSTDGLHIAALAINGTYIYEWIPAQYNTYKENILFARFLNKNYSGIFLKGCNLRCFFFGGGGSMKIQYLLCNKP